MKNALAYRIIDAAADAYGVTVSDLKSSGYQNCPRARNAAMAIIMDLVPGMSSVTLGMIMDGRQPQTVRSAVGAHRQLIRVGCPQAIQCERKIRSAVLTSAAAAVPHGRTMEDVMQSMGL